MYVDLHRQLPLSLFPAFLFINLPPVLRITDEMSVNVYPQTGLKSALKYRPIISEFFAYDWEVRSDFRHLNKISLLDFYAATCCVGLTSTEWFERKKWRSFRRNLLIVCKVPFVLGHVHQTKVLGNAILWEHNVQIYSQSYSLISQCVNDQRDAQFL